MSSRRETTILRAVIGAAVVLSVACAFAIQPGAKDASPGLTFLGRFHVLALHLPIGLLVAVLLGEGATLLRPHRDRGDVIVTSLLPVVVVTGCAAIVLGLLLAHGESYPAKLVARHRNLTLAGVVVASLAALALPLREKAGRWGHRALLGAAAGLMTFGAHFGGSMTHGADFLDPSSIDMKKPPMVPDDVDAGAAPAPVPVEEPVDAGAVPAVVTVDAGPADAAAPAPREAGAPKPQLTTKQIVQGTLNRKCAPCHTSKSKGGLRVSDVSNMKAGSVVPGDPGSSKVYTRLTLPLDDDDHMPPQGETQMTAGEIAAVKKWISELQ